MLLFFKIVSIDKFLLQHFFTFCESKLPPKVAENIQSLRELSDLRYPSEWFPEARQMQRLVFFSIEIYLRITDNNNKFTFMYTEKYFFMLDQHTVEKHIMHYND